METNRRRNRSMIAVAVTAVACLVLAACGGSGGSGQSNGEAVAKVTVGTLPITAGAALELGVRKGFFAAERLEVKTESAQSGAAVVPAVVAGQYQFGFSNNLSLILAYEKGLPIRIVRSSNTAGSDPAPPTESLMVGKDIRSLKDLEGKTVALSSLNSTPHLATLVALENHGVDTKKVKFVELGMPDMPNALQQGRVAGADVWEPFITVGLGLTSGEKDLAHPSREIESSHPVSSWFTTQKYLDTNKDVVKRFARAVDKSNAYAMAHMDEIRAFVPTYLKIEPNVANEMAADFYPQGLISLASLQKLAALAKHFGIIQSTPYDLSALLVAKDIG